MIRLWLCCSQVVAQRSSMGTQSYLPLSTLQARYHARDPESCPAQTLCTSTRVFSPRRCIYFQSGCCCSPKGTSESHLFSPGLILHLLFTKQPNPRKKAERRVSSRGLSVLSDDNQRKVKGTREGAIPLRRSEIHELPQRRRAGLAWPLARPLVINGDRLRVVLRRKRRDVC